MTAHSLFRTPYADISPTPEAGTCSTGEMNSVRWFLAADRP